MLETFNFNKSLLNYKSITEYNLTKEKDNFSKVYSKKNKNTSLFNTDELLEQKYDTINGINGIINNTYTKINFNFLSTILKQIKIIKNKHYFEDTENVYKLLEIFYNQTLNDLLKLRLKL